MSGSVTGCSRSNDRRCEGFSSILKVIARRNKGIKELHQKKQDTGVGTITPYSVDLIAFPVYEGNNCRKRLLCSKANFDDLITPSGLMQAVLE